VQILTKIIKTKLRSPPCRNRGFVLDGYPRTLEEAKLLFTLDDDEEISVSDTTEDNKLPDQPLSLRKDESTIATRVIRLEVNEDTAKNRSINMSDSLIVPKHNDQDGFARRWKR
jgi:adenylate kinase